MPTYSYKCTECGHAFDIQQAFSDASLTECPSCGGRLRKVFGTVGVTFNGSGFYRTDSRAGSKASGSDGTKKDAGGSKEASGGKQGSDSGSGSNSGGATGGSGSSSTGSGSSGSSGSGSSKKASAA